MGKEVKDRAEDYAVRVGTTIIGPLGGGYDGSVFSTDRQSAIKCLKYPELFRNDLEVYRRLQTLEIDELNGFAIPQTHRPR